MDDAARLFDEHVDALYGYVARRLGREAAADVVGDVFEIALSQSDRYEAARRSERAWLFGIATNLLRRHWRTEQRRLRATYRVAMRPALPGDALLDVAERIDAATEAERVMAALGDLAPEDRDLALLVAWGDQRPTQAGPPSKPNQAEHHSHTGERRPVNGAEVRPPASAAADPAAGRSRGHASM